MAPSRENISRLSRLRDSVRAKIHQWRANLRSMLPGRRESAARSVSPAESESESENESDGESEDLLVPLVSRPGRPDLFRNRAHLHPNNGVSYAEVMAAESRGRRPRVIIRFGTLN
jgi:hypothetical protein